MSIFGKDCFSTDQQEKQKQQTQQHPKIHQVFSQRKRTRQKPYQEDNREEHPTHESAIKDCRKYSASCDHDSKSWYLPPSHSRPQKNDTKPWQLTELKPTTPFCPHHANVTQSLAIAQIHKLKPVSMFQHRKYISSAVLPCSALYSFCQDVRRLLINFYPILWRKRLEFRTPAEILQKALLLTWHSILFL